MKRCLAICALVALGSAAVRADVTVTTEVTIDGPMAAMMSGAMPRLNHAVKGTKARTDMEVMGQSVSTITDLTSRQVIVLTPSQKTAQVFDTESGAGPGAERAGDAHARRHLRADRKDANDWRTALRPVHVLDGDGRLADERAGPANAREVLEMLKGAKIDHQRCRLGGEERAWRRRVPRRS